MTNCNKLTDAFEALTDVPEMQCYGFGNIAVLGFRGNTYLRITDVVRACHVWYVNDSLLPGWRGINDEKLMDDLSSAYAESAWSDVLMPLEDMGNVLVLLTGNQPANHVEEMH